MAVAYQKRAIPGRSRRLSRRLLGRQNETRLVTPANFSATKGLHIDGENVVLGVSPDIATATDLFSVGNATQATTLERPHLVAAALNGLDTMDFAAAAVQQLDFTSVVTSSGWVLAVVFALDDPASAGQWSFLGIAGNSGITMAWDGTFDIFFIKQGGTNYAFTPRVVYDDTDYHRVVLFHQDLLRTGVIFDGMFLGYLGSTGDNHNFNRVGIAGPTTSPFDGHMAAVVFYQTPGYGLREYLRLDRWMRDTFFPRAEGD